MVSRKYAVRINFCCRSCPTAPSGPEGGAIFHPGDVELFPLWGPFTNDVRQKGVGEITQEADISMGGCVHSKQHISYLTYMCQLRIREEGVKISQDVIYEWPFSLAI